MTVQSQPGIIQSGKGSCDCHCAEGAARSQPSGAEATASVSASAPTEGMSHPGMLRAGKPLSGQQSYGSRLALSLGDLDIPQSLAERDVSQQELAGMSPSVRSEPEPFGGRMEDSLSSLGHFGGNTHFPPLRIVPAGKQPHMVNLMHNLAHLSAKVRQHRSDMGPQMSHPVHSQGIPMVGLPHLDSQSVSPSMQPRVTPAEGLGVPRAQQGGCPFPFQSRYPAAAQHAQQDVDLHRLQSHSGQPGLVFEQVMPLSQSHAAESCRVSTLTSVLKFLAGDTDLSGEVYTVHMTLYQAAVQVLHIRSLALVHFMLPSQPVCHQLCSNPCLCTPDMVSRSHHFGAHSRIQ